MQLDVIYRMNFEKFQLPNIQYECGEYPRRFHEILSVSHNIVMNMNNVMVLCKLRMTLYRHFNSVHCKVHEIFMSQFIDIIVYVKHHVEVWRRTPIGFGKIMLHDMDIALLSHVHTFMWALRI